MPVHGFGTTASARKRSDSGLARAFRRGRSKAIPLSHSDGFSHWQPLQTWLANVGRVLGGLFWQGETHLRHNLPGRPYLDPVQAILFLAGVVRAAIGVAQPRYLFLLIWFAVMLLPSVLSGDAPHFGRLSGALAPASILVALGAAWLAGRAADRTPIE